MATRQTIVSGYNGNPSSTVTTYYHNPFGSFLAWDTFESVARVGVVTTPGKLTNFQTRVGTAPGAGKSWVFTIRKGTQGGAMSNTALSVTIADTNVLSSVDTDEVTVSAGDKIIISAVPSGTPDMPARLQWRFDFIPDTAGETLIAGSTNSFKTYHCPQGARAGDTTEFDIEILFPTAGTVKRLFVELNAPPGAAASTTYTVRKNGVATALAVTLTGSTSSDAYKSDLVNSFTVAAGDRISIGRTGSSSATQSTYGVTFLPDTQGEFCAFLVTDDSTSTSAVEYCQVNSPDSALSATEARPQQLSGALTAKKQYVRLSTAPAAGNTWTFGLRVNAADSSPLLQTSISDANLTGNATQDVAISAEQLLSTRIDATPGTATSKTQISYLLYIEPTGGGTAWELFPTDSVAIADSISKGVGKVSADTMSLADGIVKAVAKNPSDNMAIADSFDRTVDYTRAFSDIVSIADSVGKAVGKPLADTMTIADSINILRFLNIILADTVTIADALTKGIALSKADTFIIADGLVKTLGMTQTDAVAIADSISKQVGLAKADSVSITDSLSKMSGLNKADNMAIADSIAKQAGLNKSDDLLIGDSLAKSIGLNKADSVTITDSIGKFLTKVRADTVIITDTISKGVAKVISDAMAIAESMIAVITGAPTHVINLFDNVTITDHLEGVHHHWASLRQSVSRMAIKRLGIARMALYRWVTRRFSA